MDTRTCKSRFGVRDVACGARMLERMGLRRVRKVYCASFRCYFLPVSHVEGFVVFSLCLCCCFVNERRRSAGMLSVGEGFSRVYRMLVFVVRRLSDRGRPGPAVLTGRVCFVGGTLSVCVADLE